jgi:hypothetical protein
MTRPHGRDDAGRPLNLIGQPLEIRHAPPPQPFIVTKEDAMAKAERNGVYTLHGLRYIIRAGDPLPDGAELDPDPEERAKGKAPENKSKQAAPENRAKGEK